MPNHTMFPKFIKKKKIRVQAVRVLLLLSERKGGIRTSI